MKLPKSILKVALKALKDVGAATDDIIKVRKGGTLEDVFEAASKVETGPLYRPIATPRINLRTTEPSLEDAYASGMFVDDAAEKLVKEFRARNLLTPGSASLSGLNEVARTLDQVGTGLTRPAASFTAMRRLGDEKREAMLLLDKVTRNRNVRYTPRTLLTANQIARNPAGRKAVEEAISLGAPDPIYAARALLREGLSDQQKEIFLSLVQNGYSPDDAAQLAKALS